MKSIKQYINNVLNLVESVLLRTNEYSQLYEHH